MCLGGFSLWSMSERSTGICEESNTTQLKFCDGFPRSGVEQNWVSIETEREHIPVRRTSHENTAGDEADIVCYISMGSLLRGRCRVSIKTYFVF